MTYLLLIGHICGTIENMNTTVNDVMLAVTLENMITHDI